MRSGLIVIVALSLVLGSCATIPTPQEANDTVLVLRKYGNWAWALGIALIWADLVSRIPQTAVITALGIIYGTLLGGLLGSLGLITGGLLGYGLRPPRGASRNASLGPGLCTRWRECSTGAVLGRSSSPAAFPTASRRVRRGVQPPRVPFGLLFRVAASWKRVTAFDENGWSPSMKIVTTFDDH